MVVKWHETTPAAKTAARMGMYRVSPTTFFDPRRPYCDSPVSVSMSQRAGATPGVYVERFAPCRKCEKCLLFRRLSWRDRMAAEISAVPRTWFVTLTFSPIHLAGIIAEALARREQDEEGRVEAAAYGHVQGYFKRLRKAGCRFRYAAIPEYGEEQGRLHYHVLIHETEPNSVTYRILDTKWRSFVQANLVRSPKGAASYAAKYLTKSLSRIRASERYGTNEPSPMRSNQEVLLVRLLKLQNKKSGLTYPPVK